MLTKQSSLGWAARSHCEEGHLTRTCAALTAEPYVWKGTQAAGGGGAGN